MVAELPSVKESKHFSQNNTVRNLNLLEVYIIFSFVL